ncbi:MAG: 16S rRNA processing protein RimM [Ignavibacteria bacterium]|nr:16S rRNA processing protein RimM [Ignavibacteria bacterium]
MIDKQLIAVGKIIRCVGIKGAVKIHPYASLPKRFSLLTKVFLGETPQTAEQYEIREVELRGAYVVVTFSNIPTRNDAEKIVGKYIFVNELQRVSLQQNEWFIDDILGCEVFVRSVSVGVVRDVITLPAQDVWVVHQGGKEVLVPAVRAFIESVDVKNKIIVLRPPEGLIQFDE